MAGLTHASFFSGVGGMDIGLERAGWQTVSFAEIEPYPRAVLAERWPHVPNLGDITKIDRDGFQHDGGHSRRAVRAGFSDPTNRDRIGDSVDAVGVDWRDATLWTGGFPCQDLSIAGKRGGIDASRSGLAWSFLDLVERYRPEAFILENVPGLLSSNSGRDFGRLLREVGELRYGWAYRVLDAQWFGVPQRRRRVFVLALDLDRHPDADSASEVLAIGTSCGRDHQEERAAWAKASRNPYDGPARLGIDIAGNLTTRYGKGINTSIDDGAIVYGPRFAHTLQRSLGHHGHSSPCGDGADNLVVTRRADCDEQCGPSPDAAGVRAPDGVAGRMDDLPQVAFVKIIRSGARDEAGNLPPEVWAGREVAPTLNGFDVGDARATTIVAPTVNSNRTGGWRFDADQVESLVIAGSESDDPFNPDRLDSNRYRAIGNGVAAPVAEWIGARLASYLMSRDA